MGRKQHSPGLVFRGGIWHIDKRVKGYGRLCESTGESSLNGAEAYLRRRLEEIEAARRYGIRPSRTWRQAATHYLNTVQKRSLDRDAQDLAALDPFIGDLPLDRVHMGTLEPFIRGRRDQGAKASTVNRSLAVVRRVLNLAARLWRDEFGMTWLATPPMIVLLPLDDARGAYPLNWEEQIRLFAMFPSHLERMALFKVNTGTREQEVCGLRWDWEVAVPELDTSVFIVPKQFVKNAEDRLIVLNQTARSVIEDVRGRHRTYVFTYKGNRVTRMLNSAWKRARRKAGLPLVRVHDLKHTFGRRLRAAGVPLETRKALLGHTNGDITTHYSAPELAELIEAAGRVETQGSRKTHAVTILRMT